MCCRCDLAIFVWYKFSNGLGQELLWPEILYRTLITSLPHLQTNTRRSSAYIAHYSLENLGGEE
jgi:hypothetical protein